MTTRAQGRALWVQTPGEDVRAHTIAFWLARPPFNPFPLWGGRLGQHDRFFG
jgi:hypothetical protein